MSNIKRFSSRKEVTEFLKEKGIDTSNWSEEKWLSLNKGQAEIHMMALAEKIYDEYQNSVPRKLKEGEWHLPMLPDEAINLTIEDQLKWCVGIHANTSYTVVGDGKKLTLETASRIHDKCKEEVHSSVFEHCARAMSDEEYHSFTKGSFIQEMEIDKEGFIDISTHTNNSNSFGWCRNFKGFIQYRHFIESEKR